MSWPLEDGACPLGVASAGESGVRVMFITGVLSETPNGGDRTGGLGQAGEEDATGPSAEPAALKLSGRLGAALSPVTCEGTGHLSPFP